MAKLINVYRNEDIADIEVKRRQLPIKSGDVQVKEQPLFSWTSYCCFLLICPIFFSSGSYAWCRLHNQACDPHALHI